MNGMNQLFMNDPASFLGRVCIDNRAEMFGTDRLNAADIVALNNDKKGDFDFATGNPDAKIMLSTCAAIRLVSPSYQVVKDTPIKAYWCPFISGGSHTIGWVDVPRVAPLHRFIFTAAMQGCCYVVTNSPASRNNFRVWHNQHPDMEQSWDTIKKSGATTIYSQLTYTNYGGNMVNAFNILWRPPKAAWHYVSQSNQFVPSLPPTGLVAWMTGTDRNYTPVITLRRDASRPILTLPAGV